MAKYTIEDIEILRQKSGISYEEAVNLLEYHNGSLARALVDLEKNGRIKTEKNTATHHRGFKGMFDFLYRLRLIVKKDTTVIVNLSALFLLITAIIAPHVLIVGLILCLVLGYRINMDRKATAFAQDGFDDIVKNARSNVQHTVQSFAQQFAKTAEEPKPEEQEAPRTQSAASGTRPVNVQFPDEGSVDVRDGGDGYHEADIQ